MAESILEEAQRIVHGERQDDYGHPIDNHQCTADLVRTWVRRKYGIDIPFAAEDVCWFHILEKAAREANAHKRDNLTDTAGYAANVEMIEEERQRRGGK